MRLVRTALLNVSSASATLEQRDLQIRNPYRAGTVGSSLVKTGGGGTGVCEALERLPVKARGLGVDRFAITQRSSGPLPSARHEWRKASRRA